MFEWWDSLSVISQVFACIAIPATLILLIQTIAMLVGLDTETGDVDVDVAVDVNVDVEVDVPLDAADGVFGDDIPEMDLDPSGLLDLKLFTIRGIIAFLVVFGWVGFALDSAGASFVLTLVIAIVCGFAMMVFLAVLMRTVMKLRSDGNIDNRNALGVSGKVYLTIPAARTGEGKVNILVQGAYVEREAVTDEAEPIPTGSEIVVIGLSGQTTLVVKRK